MFPHLLPVFMKVVGSVTLMLTSWSIGDFVAKRLERQLAEMRRFESALVDLGQEISYSLAPLPRALQRVGERTGGETGKLFAALGSTAGLAQRRTPTEALFKIVGESQEFPGTSISPFEMELLEDLLKSLGMSGHTEQLRHIDMISMRARVWREDFQEQAKKKARVYRYLGALSGACMVIILL